MLRKIVLNDVDLDLTPDSIASEVTRIENGISSCMLRAQNTDGYTFLNSLIMNDDITIKYTDDDNNLVEVFWGNVSELTPSLDVTGQIIQAEIVGIGYCLKLVRVNTEYGQTSLQIGSSSPEYVNVLGNSVGFTPLVLPARVYVDGSYENTDGWAIGVHFDNVNPYVGSYQLPNYPYFGIDFQLDVDGDGIIQNGLAKMGDWKFVLLPIVYKNMIPTLLRLCIIAKMVRPDPESVVDHPPNTLTFTPQYKIASPYGDGDWHDFSETFFLDLNVVGESQTEQWIDIIGVADTLNKINNMEVRLQYTGASIDATHRGGCHIYYMYLELQSIHNNMNTGNSVQQIVAGTPSDPDNSGTTLLELLEQSPPPPPDTPRSSGWSLDGSKIPNTFTYKIPYVNFPYLDVFTCINDLCRISNAIAYLSSFAYYRGLHWTVLKNGSTDYLLIDQVGQHSPDVEALWASRCPMNPIVVKQDMIAEKFVSKIPIANYVLVGGQFRNPYNDDYCENSVLNSMGSDGIDRRWWWVNGGSLLDSPSLGYEDSNTLLDFETYNVGSSSMQFHRGVSVGGSIPSNWTHWLYDSKGNPITLDFTKLMGRDTKPHIEFWYKTNNQTKNHKFRLYSTAMDTQTKTGYFEADLTKYATPIMEGQGVTDWIKVDLEIPNNMLTNNGTWVQHGEADWTAIRRFGIYWETVSDIIGEARVWIDGLVFKGTVIRGYYDSTSIAAVGLRTAPPIKNSSAEMDTLNPNDRTSQLSMFALSELIRGLTPITTGVIKVPLNPWIREGQIVEIISENYLESTITHYIENLVNTDFPTSMSLNGWDAITYYNFPDYYPLPNVGIATEELLTEYGFPGAALDTCYCIIESGLGQDLTIPILVSNILTFTMKSYHTTANGTTVKIHYNFDDNTSMDATINIPNQDSWNTLNLLTPLISGGKSDKTLIGFQFYFDGSDLRFCFCNDISLISVGSIEHHGTEFRINKVIYRYNVTEAVDELYLTSDIQNSLPLTFDPYSISMRAISPDMQSKTFTSVRNSGGDFDPLLTPIVSERPTS